MGARSALLLICLMITTAASAADTGAAMLADFEKSVTEFTLSNGMKFIIVRRPEVPVVACHVYVM